jgi:glycosyltransferase involved in cell wall biosynthesis
MRRRLAVVVQRYGAEVGGGAELLARQVAERLSRGHDLEVLTTCALDYVTWADHYPAGPGVVNGVRVLRFPVPVPRDLHQFHPAHARVVAGDRGPAAQRSFLAEQGPYAPGLSRHVRDHAGAYDAVVFFTALYPTTLLCLPLVAERSILVPTLHDEPPMHLPIYGRVLSQAAFIIYNTPEERELAERLYGLEPRGQAIAGIGITPPLHLDGDGVLRRHRLDRPYLLYAGRIDRLKGSTELFRDFLALCERDDRADLVLIGHAAAPIPHHPRIRHLGFVSDEDRWGLLADAVATVIPSRLESLSIVALESLAAGTPLLVPSASPVLEGQVRRSHGGLVYTGPATFVESCLLLLDRPDTAAALGRNGHRYVMANYGWDRIDAIWETAVATVTSGLQ